MKSAVAVSAVANGGKKLFEIMQAMEAAAKTLCQNCKRPRGMNIEGGMFPQGTCTHCGARYPIYARHGGMSCEM